MYQNFLHKRCKRITRKLQLKDFIEENPQAVNFMEEDKVYVNENYIDINDEGLFLIPNNYCALQFSSLHKDSKGFYTTYFDTPQVYTCPKCGFWIISSNHDHIPICPKCKIPMS